MKPITIVALAIVAAIGLTLGFNFTESTETRTSYQEIADITPTVEHGDVLDYAELSPSSNFTGFSPYSSYTFKQMPDNAWSRYSVMPAEDPVTEAVDDVKTGAAVTLTASSESVAFIETGSGIISSGTCRSTSLGFIHVTPTNPVSLKELSGYLPGSQYKAAIKIDSACVVPLKLFGTYSVAGASVTVYAGQGAGMWRLASYVTYTPATSTASAYWSGTDASFTPLWTVDASSDYKPMIVWGGSYVTDILEPDYTNGFSNTATGPGPSPLAATVTTTELLGDSAVYMDARYGVTVQNTDSSDIRLTRWSNGYVNGQIDFLIASSSGYLQVYYDNGLTSLFTLTRERLLDGRYTDEILIRGLGESVTVSPRFPALLVSVDAVKDEIRVTPVADFIDFFTYTLTDATYTLKSSSMGIDPMEGLAMRGATTEQSGLIASPVNLAIVKTLVSTDPDSLLWLDPVINPMKWFPQSTYSPYSVYFRSVVASGDSLRVNNLVFAVSDGQVEVNGSKYPLNGMRIDFRGGAANGDVFLVFSGSKQAEIDLGYIEDTYIYGTGIWYAQIDLQSMAAESKDVLKYDPDGWKGATVKTVLVLFMAICTALALWAARAKELSTGGFLTVGISVIVAWIVLGAFL